MTNKIVLLFTLLQFFLAAASNVYAGNLSYHTALYTNDTYLEHQYYLEQIKALEAWETISESPEVVVAVIDSGVDIEHPDLAENIWRNPDEISNDGIDNDENGYIDDIKGWDFVLNSPDPKPTFGGEYTELGINHGTLVAGVIGAIGNNSFGITGVSWKIKIMPLKVMDGVGSGATNLVYQAIKYAISEGADIINLSMVGDLFDPLLDKVIAEAYQQGIIIVAAAGNERDLSDQKQDVSFDLAQNPQYPICHDGGDDNNYVLGVGSVDYNDIKSSFSNYGSKCLDLVAPGKSFYGTLFFSPVMPGFNKYFGGYWSGTSLGVPQVSATAALVKALRPDLVNAEIYDLIINNADNIDSKNPDFTGLLGGGRLNIKKVILAAGGQVASGVDLVAAPLSQHMPMVKVINRLGQQRSEFLAYNENFKGGVNLVTVDLENDGQKEIITGVGQGGGPHIRIFNHDGELKGQFFAYDINFTGGVNVTAGDIDGDGLVEIVTAPQSEFKPLIRIFDLHGNLKNEFLAFEQSFKGGVNLALSDINADGIKEIVTAQGPGAAPEVKIFNEQGKLLNKFLAYNADFNGGVKVAAYNLYSDARTEILTSPQTNYKPQIRIFSPSGNIEYQWLAWEENYLKGINITVGNVDNDNQLEIVVSKSKGGEPEVKIFDFQGGLENQFIIFDNDFRGGINIAIK